MGLISLGKVYDVLKKQETPADSKVIYMDQNGNVVEKTSASQYIITQYDKDGKVINTIRGYINNDEVSYTNNSTDNFKTK